MKALCSDSEPDARRQMSAILLKIVHLLRLFMTLGHTIYHTHLVTQFMSQLAEDNDLKWLQHVEYINAFIHFT